MSTQCEQKSARAPRSSACQLGRVVALVVTALFSVATSGGSERRSDSQSPSQFRLAQQKLRLVAVPAGEFLMGSDDGSSDEEPVTRVTISRPFWIGATEVTVDQYRMVMEVAGSDGRLDHAVADVTWHDAMEFCRRLNQRARQAGWLPEGYEFSLPTEAQWEYSCRAGTKGDFAGNLSDLGWYSGNAGMQRQPGRVAQKLSNAWGLFDMHGNRWEWCRDWYGSYSGVPVSDPTGPAAGSFRVGRGGSSSHLPSRCRSAARNFDSPEYQSGDLGFRIVLTTDSATGLSK